MAEPLQNTALFKKLHIALFLFVILIAKSSQAQSLLLPGDIVFVSVNADSNSFEFVPLIDIEEGTIFSISNGDWDNNAQEFSTDTDGVIEFIAFKDISAGTPVKFNNNQNQSAFATNGSVQLSGEQENLFIFQKDEDQTRFIFGLGWGEKRNRRDRTFFGSDIPAVFSDNPKALLRLGNFNNYQYFIRNGASGTPNMLFDLIANAGYWRGSNDKVFPEIGTSFNLLSPPVILFDQSLTSVKENEERAKLNIAIYEHDGSKLTVDVVFDSLYSSIDNNEIKGFKSQKVNFTGLIGNAVYEIEVPIENDEKYEGIETGIFSLQNLSKGRFGDFISHTVLVLDDELPEVQLELSSSLNENILLIHNLESRSIDLGGWELVSGDLKMNFVKNTQIGVGESLVLIEYKEGISDQILNASYLLDRDEAKILNSTGVIQLRNYEGEKIAEGSSLKKDGINSELLSQSSNLERSQVNEKNIKSDISTSTSVSPSAGWKANLSSQINVNDYSDIDFYLWDEAKLKFQKIGEDVVSVPEDELLIGYFDEASAAKLVAKRKSVPESSSDQGLTFKVTTIDVDENGLIDGLEGLNLLKNSSSIAVTIEQLRTLIKNKLELQSEVRVFKSSPNFSTFDLPEPESLILPNEVFWLKFNTEIDEQSLSIDFREISISNVKKEEVEKGIFELEVNGASKQSSFQIDFVADEQNQSNKLNLKLNSDLYLNPINEVVFSGLVGKTQYDVYGINPEVNNVTRIPLNFASSKNGEFELKVKNWTDIPLGWVIEVEDLKEEKIYELDESWSLKFSYSNSNISEADLYNEMIPSVEERFVLKVTPEALVDKEEGKELPSSVELNQNYPNPFNPSTTITFYIPEEATVKLSVFNIVGQPVSVLLQEPRSKGEHTIEWDASDMPSGIYIYQLEVGTKIMTRKMTLVK